MTIKLNLGSSCANGKYKYGWINFDIIKNRGVSVIGDGCNLPFKDNSFDEIHCVHVLEHVTRDKYFPMLKEMYRVLKPNHFMYVEVPDFIKVIGNLLRTYEVGNFEEVHKWTTSVYGKNERKGMAHHNGFTRNVLNAKIKEVGFKTFYELTEKKDMISSHYKQEPIILIKALK